MNSTSMLLDGFHVVDKPTSPLPSATTAFVLLMIISWIMVDFYKPFRKGKLPPGPKPLPIIGNLRDIPSKGALVEDYWTPHRELYGPISSVSVPGQDIIIINDARIAYELLTKRSSKYSNRPAMTFAGKMCGLDQAMLFSQADKRFTAMRKSVHPQLGSTSAVQKWEEDINIEVRRYLLRTLNDPKEVFQHIRTQAATIILKIIYGYTVNPFGRDILVDRIEQWMLNFNEAVQPGQWMVDFLPALQYIPDWFPGATFKRLAKEWKADTINLCDMTYEFAKRQTLGGDVGSSVVSDSLAKTGNAPTEDDVDVLKWAAMTMYAGGADTTVTATENFYLAMARHPAVQRKAQQEIDSVIGTDRLPNHSDLPNLPYVAAILKEVIRWQPVGSTVVPHAAAVDDEYDGYNIPKGTMIIVNAHGIFHDPTKHADHTEFNPDRFLGDKPEPDPHDITWGYGKRVCPGRHIAVSNLTLQFAMTLAAFDIKAIKGQEPEVKFIPGLVRHPQPFKVDVSARSPQHEKLVRSVETDHPFPAHGDAELLPKV